MFNFVSCQFIVKTFIICIYWVKERKVSVHRGTNCTLCSYDKYHSDIVVKIMEEKIKKEFDNADEHIKQMIKEIMGE